jgi:hypothetical protein
MDDYSLYVRQNSYAMTTHLLLEELTLNLRLSGLTFTNRAPFLSTFFS